MSANVETADPVAQRVKKLRGEFEKAGYKVIERPGPEFFPSCLGELEHEPPSLLAQRANEHHVIEIRGPAHSYAPLNEIARRLRSEPGWYFFVTGCDNAVPYGAPGNQGAPPDWPELERTVMDAVTTTRALPSWAQLLALWTALEALLRRTAADERIPMADVPTEALVDTLNDHGLIPLAAYAPLNAAHEVHRCVRHGFEHLESEVEDAVSTVLAWLPVLLPAPVERAA